VEGDQGVGGDERLEQVPDAVIELVANPAHDIERLPSGVVERPVLIALSRIDGTRVTAPEGDDDIGGAKHLIGQWLGKLERHVDAKFSHRVDDNWVDLLLRMRAGRADPHPSVREMVRECHLAAPGVVLAHEQHLRQVLLDCAVRLRHGPELLAGEPGDDHRQEVRPDLRPVANVLV